jgi:hypothetical protein
MLTKAQIELLLELLEAADYWSDEERDLILGTESELKKMMK